MMRDEVDDVLRAYAKSELIDNDPDAEQRSKDRAVYMEGVEALYPGKSFRAPRRQKQKTNH